MNFYLKPDTEIELFNLQIATAQEAIILHFCKCKYQFFLDLQHMKKKKKDMLQLCIYIGQEHKSQS